MDVQNKSEHNHVWAFVVPKGIWKCEICGKIVTRDEMREMTRNKVMVAGVLVDKKELYELAKIIAEEFTR